MPDNAIIEFRGVTKTFETNVVLSAVDLSMRPGEVLVILGGSGSARCTRKSSSTSPVRARSAR